LERTLIGDRGKVIAVKQHNLATRQRRLNVVLDILASVLEEPLQLSDWRHLLSAMLRQLPQLLPPWSCGGFFQADHVIPFPPQALV
jgi:hypothetical protein